MKLSKVSAVVTAIILIMSSHTLSAQKFLFYLHGAIMEGQKGNAVSPYFGEYHYDSIVDTFRNSGFTVMSEIRKANTNIADYARHVTAEIDSLMKQGVKANDITVIGASKGALIAMYVSTFVKNRDVNFVFLAACNDGNFSAFPDIQFYGNILSIYEKSDDIGESCIRFKNKASSTIDHYKEIEINTGLQHGFLFRPLPQWVTPATNWANGKYE